MLNTTSALCKRVFLEYLSTPSRGHTCHHHTLQRSKHSFWWYGMKIFIQSAVRDCDIRQGNKHENLLTPGLLQPLSIHDQYQPNILIVHLQLYSLSLFCIPPSSHSQPISESRGAEILALPFDPIRIVNTCSQF